MQQTDATSAVDGPVSIRLSVFGPLGIEWRGSSVPFPPERLRGKGAATALSLLKALLCQPLRFASRDWILEQFWPESSRKSAEERLHDVATGLRQILCPTSATKILHYIHAGPRSGSGYRLEAYPGLWVDADAFEWYMEQALRLDRFDHPSLTLWEQAYQLASRGPFLPEEIYCDWAVQRRQDLEGKYRQCVHRIAHLLRESGYREEAILRLRTFWVAHPMDEDSLRPLMELLAEQERFGEAQDYYHHLVTVLAEDHLAPDARTEDVMHVVATQQIHRQHFVSLPPTHISERFPMGAPSTSLAIWTQNSLQTYPEEGLTDLVQGPGETRHLIGRESWLARVLALLQGSTPKKLVVLHGPIGVGKSSELNRLAGLWKLAAPSLSSLVKITLPVVDAEKSPEVALDLLLGTLLLEYQHPPLPATASLQMRINSVLSRLTQQNHPGLILLDNAEGLLIEQGQLAPCWEMFLTQFLRGQHQATLLLATKEWHGWPGR